MDDRMKRMLGIVVGKEEVEKHMVEQQQKREQKKAMAATHGNKTGWARIAERLNVAPAAEIPREEVVQGDIPGTIVNGTMEEEVEKKFGKTHMYYGNQTDYGSTEIEMENQRKRELANQLHRMELNPNLIEDRTVFDADEEF